MGIPARPYKLSQVPGRLVLFGDARAVHKMGTTPPPAAPNRYRGPSTVVSMLGGGMERACLGPRVGFVHIGPGHWASSAFGMVRTMRPDPRAVLRPAYVRAPEQRRESELRSITDP